MHNILVHSAIIRGDNTLAMGKGFQHRLADALFQAGGKEHVCSRLDLLKVGVIRKPVGGDGNVVVSYLLFSRIWRGRLARISNKMQMKRIKLCVANQLAQMVP